MALMLENGGVYKAERFRSGSNERGDWELIVVKGEGRGKQEMTVYPMNVPTGMQEGDEFKLCEIMRVKKKKAKDRDGNWTREEVDIWATIERIKPVDIGAFSSSYDDISGEFTDSLDDLL